MNTMKKITLISCSTRPARKSHAVALALEKAISSHEHVDLVFFDLLEEKLPMFVDRIDRMDEPHPGLLKIANRLKESDQLILVSPEYNGTYTAALKSLVDSMNVSECFAGKEVGIVAVSGGIRGGIRAGMQMQMLMLNIMAKPLPNMLLVPQVTTHFDEDGKILSEQMQGMVDRFVATLLG
jgi:NAD(P)H-dependent FMN reductase